MILENGWRESGRLFKASSIELLEIIFINGNIKYKETESAKQPNIIVNKRKINCLFLLKLK